MARGEKRRLKDPFFTVIEEISRTRQRKRQERGHEGVESLVVSREH